jgi:threonine dehydrogenase-like Zn-dependent dehydrogenase
MMTASDSLFLEPEATYPFIPGHEIVGALGERRVAIWPVIGCRARNLDMCGECREGRDGFCTRRHDGWPNSGVTIGFNSDTGGGWSEEFLAHETQLRSLPDTVSDKNALLLDPSCAALAALLRADQTTSERVLVIGGGTIGQLLVRLRKALRLPGDCEIIVRYDHQARAAKAFADSVGVVRNQREFEDWASSRRVTSRRVQAYGLVHTGVFDRVIDCAGTRQSLAWSTSAVKPRGELTLVTAPAVISKWDPTIVWYRELTIRGVNQYRPVCLDGESLHPYDVLIPLLSEGKVDLAGLITHEFSLGNYVAAFAACVRRSQSEAIKVVFRPGAAA